jgi:uncharacterized membrane protein YccF (DUF307 family)
MSLIGNIIWIVFGGFFPALLWFFSGLLICVTIIGIPFGIQCLKISWVSLLPFGKTINPGRFGATGFILNVIWILVVGWAVAVSHFGLGLLFCITIIGIPFGIQHFKLALLSLLPFGAEIN